LFYLAPLPPEIKPFNLVPCSARSLRPGVFVHDGADQERQFTFETGVFDYISLELLGWRFGYLFVETAGPPLDPTTRTAICLLAAQLAHGLHYWNETTFFKVDLATHLLWIAGEPLSLSPKEAILLHLLDQHRGQPCSRKMLCQKIYADEVITLTQREDRLDRVVAQLKRKLKQNDRLSIKI
jgi:hypothetical protein